MNTQRFAKQVCGIKTGIIDYKESNIKSLLALNSKQNFCQIVPAGKIVSLSQVFIALEQAFDATQSKTGFSKKPELEFLIRLFGRKQLDKVLKIVQLKKGKNEVLLICAQKNKKNPQALFQKAQKVLDFKEKKILFGKNKKKLMKFYGVSQKEVQSLSDLKNPLEGIIIEKNSLVVFDS